MPRWINRNISISVRARAIYRIKQAPFGKQEREISEIISMETGYSIPFTKKNLDKIVKMGLEYQGKVSYMVQTVNGVYMCFHLRI
jgi:hypothetical protein